ncbi:hypothetical protein Tco_0513730 [Tanacetum coccineum]
MSRETYNSVMKQELIYTGNNIVGMEKNVHVFVGCHTFIIDFNILESINKLIEKGPTEVLFRKPFKENIGLEDDINKGVLWFKIGDDKTIFNMPHAKRKLGKLTTEQHNMMSLILKVSDKDKAKGGIKEFPQDTLVKSSSLAIIHSKYRAMLRGVSRSNSTLIFEFSFL